MSLFGWSIWIWAAVHVTLAYRMPPEEDTLADNFALAEDASGKLVEPFVIWQKRAAYQKPEAASAPYYRKRDPEVASSDGGEYVMGFWIPKSKRQRTASTDYSESRVPSRGDYVEWLKRHLAAGSTVADPEKRFDPYRYVRRRVCDFTRLTPSHILEYLKTGRICGRRASNIRFALTGRK